MTTEAGRKSEPGNFSRIAVEFVSHLAWVQGAEIGPLEEWQAFFTARVLYEHLKALIHLICLVLSKHSHVVIL